MYSVTNSFGLNGLRGFAVAVEADVSGGLPAFSIVGLPDSAVRESADRVRAAIKNLGFRFPDRRITINLAPRRCAQDRPGVRPAAASGAADRQRTVRRSTCRCCLSGRACTGRQSAPGVRRAAHGACRCRARHPGAVRPDRERRRGSRGLCRHHDRLSSPHRPGGGGGTEGHPPPLPCRCHPL